MFTIFGKTLDVLFGRIIEEIILIHEAFSLSDDEKKVIKKYAGKSSHQLTKEFEIDNLIKKSLATMTTQNRIDLTLKGEKLQKILKRYKI